MRLAADVLDVQWWLEERWHVGACQVVKFPKKLESPTMLCLLSLSVAEATDGGLKCFV